MLLDKILDLGLRSGFNVAKTTWKIGRSGRIGRAFLGGTIGAGIGYLGSGQDDQLSLEATAKGAFLGALIGGGIGSGLGKRVARAGVKAIFSKNTYKSLAEIGSIAAKPITFALNHPVVTAGAIGAGVALQRSNQYSSSSMDFQFAPTTFGSTPQYGYGQQEPGIIGTGAIGSAPSRKALANSTNGLVQGLHRSRH